MSSESITNPLTIVLQQAIAEFNRGDYFECHETLEAQWLIETGLIKTGLQGFVQAAAAMIKYRDQNKRGVLSLLRQALEKLSLVEKLPAFCDVFEISDWIKVLATLEDDVKQETPLAWNRSIQMIQIDLKAV